MLEQYHNKQIITAEGSYPIEWAAYLCALIIGRNPHEKKDKYDALLWTPRINPEIQIRCSIKDLIPTHSVGEGEERGFYPHIHIMSYSDNSTRLQRNLHVKVLFS